ncbi:RNA polymerase sigma factor [Haloferula sargassicola]|uniref:RNA polymerase sigma factor n=1 Tax=Haloferula sargassicola TaxID=490096 RepID=UPI00336556B1
MVSCCATLRRSAGWRMRALLVFRDHGLAIATTVRICGNRMDAEEAVQQGFAILARRASKNAEINCLGAWLHRVVVHEAVRIRKRQHSRRNEQRHDGQSVVVAGWW